MIDLPIRVAPVGAAPARPVSAHRRPVPSPVGAALVRLLSARVSGEGDRDYFRDRAEQEIALAQAASDEHLVRFHYHLAGLYLDKVHGVASVVA